MQNMNINKHTLLLLGGTWHDFDGFAVAMQPIFEEAGCDLDATYDLERLTQLEEGCYDLVILYTCLTEQREDGTPSTLWPTDVQVESLVRWVQAGGGLLATHAATVCPKVPAWCRLMGGTFIEHPPQSSFTVYPVFHKHPITTNIEAFTVHDELYIQQPEPGVDVLAVTTDRGTAYPMVWCKADGYGRVAHIAPGHGPETWNQPLYRRLIQQTIQWLSP